jgi:hypothetical protein
LSNICAKKKKIKIKTYAATAARKPADREPLLYVSSTYYTAIYVSSYYYYVCVLILQPQLRANLLIVNPYYICVLNLLCVCPHTTMCVSSYYYICVLILLYMCPHTTYMCPHTTMYVSSTYYTAIRVLILLYTLIEPL